MLVKAILLSFLLQIYLGRLEISWNVKLGLVIELFEVDCKECLVEV